MHGCVQIEKQRLRSVLMSLGIRVSSVFNPWLKKLFLLLLMLSVVAVTGCCLFFRGPYLEPEPLPEAQLLDMHCHVAGVGAGGSGCFVSPAISNSWKFGLYLEGFGTTRAEVLTEGDGVVVRRIAEQIAGSRHVGAAIVLAMDGVVDEHGELDRRRTEIYVPNEFVAQEVARHTTVSVLRTAASRASGFSAKVWHADHTSRPQVPDTGATRSDSNRLPAQPTDPTGICQ